MQQGIWIELPTQKSKQYASTYEISVIIQQNDSQTLCVLLSFHTNSNILLKRNIQKITKLQALTDQLARHDKVSFNEIANGETERSPFRELYITVKLRSYIPRYEVAQIAAASLSFRCQKKAVMPFLRRITSRVKKRLIPSACVSQANVAKRGCLPSFSCSRYARLKNC